MTPEKQLFDAIVASIAEQVTVRVVAKLDEHIRCAIRPALLNVKDAAIYLGRSEQAVQHLIFQKELPVVRVGLRVHVAVVDLDAWIYRNRF